MTNAEKMFRDLGYLKKEMKMFHYIEFFNTSPKTNEMASISFETSTKTVMASLYYDNNQLQKSRALAMTPQELQATYEFAKECGFYDKC